MTLIRQGWLLCVTGAALLASTGARAQDEALFDGDLAEGSQFRPRLDVGATYTDNFYNVPTGEQDALGALIEPLLNYAYALPRFRFGAQAGAEIGMFEGLPGNQDDYEDFHAGLSLNWQSAPRHTFSWRARFQWDHDPFGTDRTEGAVRSGTLLTETPLDEWRQQGFDLRYRYGVTASPIGLELHLGSRDKQYTTNRFLTQFLDYEIVTADATVLYNFSPKSSLLVDVVSNRVRFENVQAGAIDRSADELRYRVGVRWLATAKTTGDVRVGYVQRQARDAGRDDFSAVDWQANVSWAPLSWQQVTLQTGRRSQESYLANVEFIDNRYSRAEWTVEWTPRFSTGLAANYVNADFVGSARSDDYLSGRVNAQYIATRYLSLLGHVGISERDSTVAERDYDRLNGYLGVRLVR